MSVPGYVDLVFYAGIVVLVVAYKGESAVRQGFRTLASKPSLSHGFRGAGMPLGPRPLLHRLWITHRPSVSYQKGSCIMFSGIFSRLKRLIALGKGNTTTTG